MKYEYTNGNESEFNGAPGWAKLAISDGHSNAFCNELDYMATAVWSNGRQFKIANPTKFTIVGVRNLISEESTWNGEGLPPVGCECEVRYRHGGADWGSFKCVAVDSDVAFGWCADEPVTLLDDNYEFRPIRSEADKKRDAAIESIRAIICSPSQASATAERLYEAISTGKIHVAKLED